MKIRSSLKRKSSYALALYLALAVTLIGTVSYLVVEPPIRDQLEANLDLRTELLSAQIEEPINSSLGILQSIVAIGSNNEPQDHQERILYKLFETLQGITVSGGLWPASNQEGTQDARETPHQSLFFNRASDGLIDRVRSWDNPALGGYQQEPWFTAAVEKPAGYVAWSEVYIDPFTHIQMITASSPYYVDGRFAGVATVDISLSSLVKFVRQHAEQYDLGVILRDAYGDLVTEHNFQVVRGMYISRFQFGEFNWSVDVINAKRLVTEQVYEVVYKVEAGIVPIMLICVLIGYFLINRYLISPIVYIAKKVDDSREGGVIDITYNSQDEIRHLIDTFNQKTVYLDAEKRKAQASTEAKSAFLASLSHEIRTPMNGVLGTAQILLKTDLDDEQRKHMKTLYDSGDHMMTLLNEILDFSKIEQGRLELSNHPFPLESIIGSVNSVYYTLCNEKGLKFTVHSDVPDGRWYCADKARLRQILFNLLNNAVKFTSRGYVEVHLSEQKRDGKNYLNIEVRDSGIGIAKEAQGKIFNPFEQAESSTTRRYGGTGLGLSIVKQICELMNGEVSVTSKVGIGSSFHISIEMAISDIQPVEMAQRRKVDYKGLKALIVEDNRTNSVIMSTFLANKGFTCDCVDNGQKAIDAIGSTHYDLVLMDNHMPVMDGIESTTAIRALPDGHASTLIFGCTADLFKETQDRMYAAGVDAIISKPIDETELDDTLFQFTHRLYGSMSAVILNEEELEKALVSLFVAIENQQFEEALTYVKAIQASVDSSKSANLRQAIDNLHGDIEAKRTPSQIDLDTLAVEASQNL
ncbi:response regulator [Vibrio cholerae]